MKLMWFAGLAGVALLAAGAMTASAVVQQPPHSAVCRAPDRAQVHIAGGTFQMGSAEYYEEEGPVRTETVAPFWIDRYDVTNAEFAKFVAATHYMTDAEKRPDPVDYPEIDKDKLVAGGAVFISPKGGVRTMEDPMQWWSFVAGADWRHPDGPDSTIAGHDNDPVVQVSYNDASAYAKWAGRELPTEAQYEFAARGGLDGKTYGWGDELTPGGKYQANVWQGTFPTDNTVADGFSGRAPVGCFPANGYGLYDTIGNVWKWTSSLYATASTHDEMPDMPMSKAPASRVLRAIKGGSFLCAPNYCRRYRPAARQPQETSFSAAHLGFRTVSNRP
ncbi:MAG TPA: formylglycine-generating enzyme family protein [Alphaproteobacteria bacterium]|jgi:formylglycine-generating enzyme required for sulfatase activity|nr:formylglycine-generating enzyme family protein [Alphaproteobacteria bacterium]